MASFTIGEVEELTGIKSHILRYWEEVIPSLAPKKDIGGRRSYSSRDLQIIFRLKYLIQEKKFTIEGARNQLIEDAGNLAEQNNSSDLILQINEIRGELLETYLLVKKYSSSQNNSEDKT
jgi:DNA-binding transcriptional MerR regulator